MENFVFVIIGTKEKNLTYSSIKFSYYGEENNLNILLADSHLQGYEKAKKNNYNYAFLVQSGTVFTDVNNFIKTINNYPHNGLIGHIVDPKHPTKYYYLDKQCLFLDLNEFEYCDFIETDFQSLIPIRSKTNIHHDYTPLWLKAGDKIQDYKYENFGNKLISKQINRQKIVVNFNQKLRSYKKFLYTEQDKTIYLESQQGYIDIAESQLWIFNNERYTIHNVNKNLICPGSGLYWILHLINDNLESINIVDISKIQIQFAKKLLENWDGKNYGEFVFNFIKENNIKHFNLHLKSISKIERLRLHKKEYFVKTVNDIFLSELKFYKVTNFIKKWKQKKHTKVFFFNENILNFKFNGPSDVWMSNILNYKYNYIKY